MSVIIDTNVSSNTDPFGVKNYFYCKKIIYDVNKFCKEPDDYIRCRELLKNYKKHCGNIKGANPDENDIFALG